MIIPFGRFALALGCSWTTFSIGCATVGGRAQTVSIDSQPRGAVVTRDDGIQVGVTPTFIDQPRGSAQAYALRFPDGATAQVTNTCEARTGFLVADSIPALPLLVLPPPLGALAFVGASSAFVGIDTANGSIFECSQSVRAQHPGSVTTEPLSDVIDDRAWDKLPAMPVEGCPRFLVAPPKAKTEEASTALALAATESLRSGSPCATVVDIARSKTAFDRHRVSFPEPRVRESFKRRDVYDVAVDTRATHLVLLELDDEEAPALARLRVVDVHSLKAAAGPSFPVTPLPAESAARGLFREVVRYLASWIPDTFIWNIAWKGFPFEATHGGERIVTNELTAPLLATALNFQLTHLDHPVSHATWDYQLSLAPDLLIFLNGMRLVVANKAGKHRTLLLDIVQVVVPLAPKIAFFTPVGVTSLWAGAGPGAILDVNEADHWRVTARLSLFAHGGISHNVFLTRWLFVGVAAQINRSFWPHVERDGVRLDWIFQAQANLGFTFPDLTDEVRTGL